MGGKVIVSWPLARVFSLGVIENWMQLRVSLNKAKTGGLNQHKKSFTTKLPQGFSDDSDVPVTSTIQGQERPPCD
jgi:hypothetical protein